MCSPCGERRIEQGGMSWSSGYSALHFIGGGGRGRIRQARRRQLSCWFVAVEAHHKKKKETRESVGFSLVVAAACFRFFQKEQERISTRHRCAYNGSSRRAVPSEQSKLAAELFMYETGAGGIRAAGRHSGAHAQAPPCRCPLAKTMPGGFCLCPAFLLAV